MTDEHRQQPDPGELPLDEQQRLSADAARDAGFDVGPPLNPGLAAVIRAATGEGATAERTAIRVDTLARSWPELAGALAALLHSEGLEVPQRWLSMDVRGGSSES